MSSKYYQTKKYKEEKKAMIMARTNQRSCGHHSYLLFNYRTIRLDICLLSLLLIIMFLLFSSVDDKMFLMSSIVVQISLDHTSTCGIFLS